MIQPRDAAKSWFERAAGQEDAFDQFSSLWFAFNALYNSHHLGQHSGEREAISHFVFAQENRLIGPVMTCIIDSPPAVFFRQRVIRDVRGAARDTREQATTLASNHRSLQRRIEALLLILYQVRCNLFHGNKIYWCDSDQEVVGNASGALMLIMKAHLGDRR